ncbi:MAG: hypothetical protein KC800_24060, partial [Candidatus Eremiobacteraeota bacterium]|nr:hypothetical protein [Candidatus Eremiobacteraeota bacterium]
SIFITTVTGSIIACLTLAVAMIFSKDVRDAVKGVQEQVQILENRAGDLQRYIGKLENEVRRGAIIWNYEERIALNTIPAGANEEAVSRIIGAMLKYANLVSIEKNNKVAFRQDVAPRSLDSILVEYTREDFEQWVKDYSNLKEPVGLWIVVKQNCLFQDNVPVTVQSFPVKRIYSEGQVVYSTEVLPSEFLLNWHVFIEELKKEALRRGMIELDDSLGAEIGGDTLSKISKTVKQTTGKITLEAVANRDLYQSSKLDVSIRVKP